MHKITCFNGVSSGEGPLLTSNDFNMLQFTQRAREGRNRDPGGPEERVHEIEGLQGRSSSEKTSPLCLQGVRERKSRGLRRLLSEKQPNSRRPRPRLHQLRTS